MAAIAANGAAPAGVVSGSGRLAGPLLGLTLVALALSWWLPLLTMRVPFLWREDMSVVTGLLELARLDLFLFLVVLLFSVLMPLAKGLLTLHVWYRVPVGQARRLLPRLALLAKLSMTELFLLALGIIAFKGVGIGQIEVRWGLYVFAGVVLASLAASVWTERLLKRVTGSG